MSSFEKEFAFISTGGKKGYYTLRIWGTIHGRGRSFKESMFVQNLSTDKEKAIKKARKLSKEMELPLNETVDFDLLEFERTKVEQQYSEDGVVQEEQPNAEDDKWTELDNTPIDELEGQDLAIALIRKGENVFVTGPGGCGKSWVVREVYDPKNTILCAPTGIAAINIGGITCHSLFGLPLGYPTTSDLNKIPFQTKTIFEGDKVKRIIIDEVGMLRADMLDLIDKRLKMIKKNNLPFGGVQVVAVGDFFQLEPIVNKEEKQIFFAHYTSPFCFTSKSWDFKPVVLSKVFRQEKLEEVAVLNSIRQKDKYYTNAVNWVMKNSKTHLPTETTTYLCARKQEASNINTKWYGMLKGKEKIYKGTVKGAAKWDYKVVPAEQNLKLKENTKVLLCANDPKGQFKNGQTGVVVKLGIKDVVVRLDSTKETVIVSPYTWEHHKYINTDEGLDKMLDKSFTQLPIKLGWAITIHASQGMTLDDVCVDVGGGCFGHGQLYVALSRIRSLENISVRAPITEKDVIVRDEVVEFYEQIGNK